MKRRWRGKPASFPRTDLQLLASSARRYPFVAPTRCRPLKCPPLAARALTRAGPSGGGEKEDGWPREPDPSSLAEAHLDNKCAGGHDDHGDISFGLSLRLA